MKITFLLLIFPLFVFSGKVQRLELKTSDDAFSGCSYCDIYGKVRTMMGGQVHFFLEFLLNYLYKFAL